MELRYATIDDLETVCEMRRRQLIDEGLSPDVAIDDEMRSYFTEAFTEDDFVEYFMEDNGEVIATGAIVFFSFPSSFSDLKGINGYISNMYTDPRYRHQGIATTILQALKAEAEKRGVKKIFISASKMGKGVYERFGFADTGEWMELYI